MKILNLNGNKYFRNEFFSKFKMILDTYLLIKQMNESKPQAVQQVVDEDVSPSRVAFEDYYNAYQQYGVQKTGSSTTSTVLMIIISIILAIFVAYVFYTCIKTNCMSFLVFVIFLVLLNIPVVNIFALIGLVIYWLVYCRKGCRMTR